MDHLYNSLSLRTGIAYFQDGHIEYITHSSILHDGVIFYINGDKYGFDSRDRTFYKYSLEETGRYLTGEVEFTEVATPCNDLLLKIEIKEEI